MLSGNLCDHCNNNYVSQRSLTITLIIVMWLLLCITVTIIGVFQSLQLIFRFRNATITMYIIVWSIFQTSPLKWSLTGRQLCIQATSPRPFPLSLVPTPRARSGDETNFHYHELVCNSSSLALKYFDVRWMSGGVPGYETRPVGSGWVPTLEVLPILSSTFSWKTVFDVFQYLLDAHIQQNSQIL